MSHPRGNVGMKAKHLEKVSSDFGNFGNFGEIFELYMFPSEYLSSVEFAELILPE